MKIKGKGMGRETKGKGKERDTVVQFKHLNGRVETSPALQVLGTRTFVISDITTSVLVTIPWIILEMIDA